MSGSVVEFLGTLDDPFFLDLEAAPRAIGGDLAAPDFHLYVFRPAHDMTLAIRIDIPVFDD